MPDIYALGFLIYAKLIHFFFCYSQFESWFINTFYNLEEPSASPGYFLKMQNLRPQPQTH